MFRQSIRHNYENKVVCFRSCLNNLVTNGRSKKSKIILIYMAYYFLQLSDFLEKIFEIFFFFSGFDRWGLGLLRNTDLITRFGRCQVSPLCSIVGTIESGEMPNRSMLAMKTTAIALFGIVSIRIGWSFLSLFRKGTCIIVILQLE